MESPSTTVRFWQTTLAKILLCVGVAIGLLVLFGFVARRSYVQGQIMAGKNASKRGDFELAISYFTDALRWDRDNAEALSRRAINYVDTKKFDLAKADAAAAVKLTPTDPAVRTRRASVYRRTGDNRTAVEEASEALLLDSRFAGAYVERGVARVNLASADADAKLASMGVTDFADAKLAWMGVTDLSRARELGHDEPEFLGFAHYIHGKLCYAVRWFEPAIDSAAEAKKLNFDSYLVSSLATSAYSAQTDYLLAVKEFDKAIESLLKAKEMGFDESEIATLLAKTYEAQRQDVRKQAKVDEQPHARPEAERLAKTPREQASRSPSAKESATKEAAAKEAAAKEAAAEASARAKLEEAEAEFKKVEIRLSGRCRTWQDASAKFTVVAEYNGYKDGNVTLTRQEDGREISLPLGQLSEPDRKWVRKQLHSKAAEVAPGASRAEKVAGLRTLKEAHEGLASVLDEIATQRTKRGATDSAPDTLRAEANQQRQRASELEADIKKLEN